MSTSEPSPKRLRLSPPADDRSPTDEPAKTVDEGIIKNEGADDAAGLPSAPEQGMNGVAPGTPAMKVEKEDTVMKGFADYSRTDHERSSDAQPSLVDNLPLLAQTPHPLSRPHPSQNLIALYGLTDLAASVARRDQETGAKINKLRKSYEGKVKKQDLPGRNKPTVMEGELMGFMEWPDEGWYDQRVHGRELEHALDPSRGRLFRSDDESQAKLSRALNLNLGRLPKGEDDKWRAALALDEPAAAAAPAAKTAALPPAVTVNGLKPSLATGMRASAPASPAGAALAAKGADRPDRSGKKRRYDDTSFEGYDGGWAEDDGYSTGGDRGGRNGKRRREFEHAQTAAPTPAPSAAAQGSVGRFGANGLVGVRSS